MNAVVTAAITPAELEEVMLTMEQAETPTTHVFYDDDVYVREVRMKKGTFAVGHHQNFKHLNVFVQGKVQMLNDDGSYTILEAPMTFVGEPGRKVGYILEDVIWRNVYRIGDRDVAALEALLLTKSEAHQQAELDHYLVDFAARQSDREDYEEVVKSLGFSPEQVKEQVEGEDQIELPSGAYDVRIGISSIEGLGVLATAPIAPGTVIGVARAGFFRTPLGRYTNHASTPNAEMQPEGDNILLVATSPIAIDEEVTIDYRATIKLLRG